MAKKTKPQAMTLPDDAVTDEQAFEIPEGMPELKGTDHLFPSARFALLHQALELVQQLQEAGLDEVGESDKDAAAAFGKLAPVMADSEKLLLDQAKDREEMAKWLLESTDLDESIQRSLAGVMVISERLGELAPSKTM